MQTPSAEPRIEDGLSGGMRLWRALRVVFGAAWMSAACFLLLPLILAITDTSDRTVIIRGANTTQLPPPPPPPEPEPEKPEEPDDPPPQLAEEAPPLDLSQLELALNAGGAGSWMKGDFGINLNRLKSKGAAEEAIFSMADLDQRPRVTYQEGPRRITPAMRRKLPGKVYVLFVVTPKGTVENPIAQRSSDPVFEKAAVDAVKKWRFEPGKRSGKAVRFKMLVPIAFPEGL